ncbi:long-chain fatty acid--CoA ligase [Paenibacillus sp. 1P07SE]|uniref:LuxE/PaaK family acyltransferase n=1 Tax=Paenibacillus sp. 1P07SE TaxID=3132209 RepID=UPI0039A62AF8
MTINTAEGLQREIMAYISLAPEQARPEEFERLALQLFKYQFANIEPFRAFCRLRGRTPRTVRTWRDIPAVPIQAFKHSTLSVSPPDEAAALFMTSGTTDPQTRGRHYHPTLAVYNQSMLTAFRRFVTRDRSRMRMGILFPEPAELPHSSLAHYLGLARTHHGGDDSMHLVRDGVLAVDELELLIEQARRSGRPLMLLGATFSFIHALDAAGGADWQLPAGSLLLDTGGIKGRSREMDAEVFYTMLSERFGVDRSSCLNMYGMTELSTQYYDSGNERLPSWKIGPHWIRPRVIDPLTGAEVPAGEQGVLVHCDLANWNAVTTILTEDIGVLHEDGRRFQLLGRAEGSAARGCSLAAESFKTAAGAPR